MSERLKSSAEDSPAKTYLARERVLASMVHNPPSGGNMPVLLASFNQSGSLLKTSSRSGREGSTEFCGPWPRSGMMRSGTVFQLPTLVRRIRGTEYGLLPTPTGTSNHGKNHVAGRLDEWGGSTNPIRGTPLGKLHCPRFEEWMMGYPDRWAELIASETLSFRKSRQK